MTTIAGITRIGTNSRVGAFAISMVAFSVCPLRAQYLSNQPIGLTGLLAGSQPPPGIYVTLPLFYRHYDLSIYNAQGDRILRNITSGLNLFTLPAIQIVTPLKIFGANVGASYMQWINNGVLDQATANFHRSTNYGFGDIYVQPLTLGWHTPRADVTVVMPFSLLRDRAQRGATCGLMKSILEPPSIWTTGNITCPQ